MKENVVLVDLSHLFYTAFHATANESISNARMATLDAVNRCMQGNYGQLLAVCCDLGRSFRKELSPEYKATREEKPAALLEEIRKTKQTLRDRGFLLWEVEGFEADDIIASASDMAYKAGHSVTIASGDKDLLQLVSPTCNALRTHLQPWKLVGIPEVVEKFGVEPYQLGDFLALVGDKSDNIKGCPGIGGVKAAELLKAHGGLNDLWRILAKDPGAVLPNKDQKPGAISKAAQALIEHRTDVELARKLVQLNFDAPIKFEEIYEKRKAKPDMSDPVDTDFDDVPISKGPGLVADVFPGATVTSAAASQNIDPASTSTATNQTNVGEPISMPAEPKPPIVQTALTTTTPEELARRNAENAANVAMSEFGNDLQPNGMRGLYWLARRVMKATTKFKNEDEALMVMLRGRDFGLSPATACDIFHVIEGKPCPPASLLVARARAHPDCEYIQCIEADETHATWEAKSKRNKNPSRVSFTIEQAKEAGLDKKNVWQKYKQDMMVWRAGLRLVRREFSDTTLGSYAAEEME